LASSFDIISPDQSLEAFLVPALIDYFELARFKLVKRAHLFPHVFVEAHALCVPCSQSNNSSPRLRLQVAKSVGHRTLQRRIASAGRRPSVQTTFIPPVNADASPAARSTTPGPASSQLGKPWLQCPFHCGRLLLKSAQGSRRARSLL
jgi:hypothetical protein